MTKSIHRAILEYQTHHGAPGSPKSPLDLRVRAAVTREPPTKDDKDQKSQSTEKIHHHHQHQLNRSNTSPAAILQSNSLESMVRASPLETVYEQEKDANTDELDNYERSRGNASNSYAIVELTDDNQVIINGASASDPIGDTPVLVSRKLSSEKISIVDHYDGDIWYTPKECVQSKVIENIEVRFEFNQKNSNARVFVK